MSGYLVFFSMFLLGLSFLDPLHFAPWVTFISEILVFFSGLLLVLAIRNVEITTSKLFLVSYIFTSIPIIQYFLGVISYFDIALINSTYIFMFLTVILVVKNLKDEDFENLINNLSYFVIFSGFISSLVAIFQFLKLDGNIPFIMSISGYRPYANMGQPNNLASLLLISIFLLLYLYWKKVFPTWVFLVISIFITIGIVLTQSRTTWLVLFFTLVFVTVYSKNKERIDLKLFYIWASLYVGLTIFLPILVGILQANNIDVLTTSSIVERSTTGYLRLEIWQQMLYAILERPLLGYGWNQTLSAQYFISDKFSITEWVGNSHNLFIDLLVWNGILVGFLLIFLILYYLYTLLKNIKNKYDMIFFLILMALFIHSMLEYPFSYGYFLLIGAISCGVLARNIRLSNSVSFRLNAIPVFIFIFGLMSIFIIWRDYLSIITLQKKAFDIDNFAMDRNLKYEKIIFLKYFDYNIQWILIDPKLKIELEEIDNIRQIIEHFPSQYNLVKFAQLLAYNGYKAEAIIILNKIDKVHHKKISYKDLFY